MNNASTWILVLSMICIAPFHAASADELTAMIEEDLAALGYDVGSVDGEADLSTTIAISKYQAEKGMDATGEVSPQLAGILAADVKNQGTTPVSNASATEAPAEPNVTAAQQVCLQQKIAEVEQQNQPQEKKGLGGMFSSLSKAAAKYGNNDIAKVSSDLYEANAAVNDLAAAARDLGISESEIAECEGESASGTATVASTSSAATAQGGSAGGTVQYAPAIYFDLAAADIGKADGSITQCNRGRPDYRQRFAKMVTEAHPGYEAKVLSIYDENFVAYELKPEYTCSDEQLSDMEKAAGKLADRGFNLLTYD